MAGRIQAGYMLAPLVMDLADKKIPVKIVSLGHRSGAVIMVRTDSPYQKFADLRGKRIAIPSRFAVDFLFLRKMLARENMTPADIEIIEMPPPDMPAALYANAVDAYCTGEPFGAAAQRAGYARVLRMTRDEWRNYICCVLTVRQELIDENRPMVQDLVNQIQGAGVWLDEKQENRDKAVAIAAGKGFFNQDPNILQFVMENPTDRVTYGDLRMIREEFDDLMQLSIQAGTIKHPIPYETYIDEQFRARAQGRVHPAVMRRTRAHCIVVRQRLRRERRRRPRSRCAQGRRAEPGDGRRRSSSLQGYRRQAARPRALSRQGGAAGVRLQHLRRGLPDHAGHARGRAQEARRGRRRTCRWSTSRWIPERDDAAQMKKFLAAFDPTFVGGVGTRAQIDAAQKSYGICSTKTGARRRQLHHRPFVVHLHDRSRRRLARRHALRPHRRRLRA